MKAELYWVEGFPVAIMPRPRGGDWLTDELSSLRAQGVHVLASLLTREEMLELEIADEPGLAQAIGLEFHHMPVADRTVPAGARETLGLVNLLAERARSGKAVAVHCRAGIGRSGTVAALVLWRLGLSVEQAFEALSRARRCPVPDTDEQRAWAVQIAANFPAQ